MFFSSFVLLSTLPLAVLGGSIDPRRHHHRKGHSHHNAPTASTSAYTSSNTSSPGSSSSSSSSSSTSSFKLVEKYQGSNFFDGWDFFTGPDPTNGLVNYLSQGDAMSAGLAYTTSDTAVIAVDSTNWVSVGGNRNSVRISSSNTYDGGLFIADIASMPYGCATWPAWWSVGPNWPEGGEIDVIEGVNTNNVNQMTLHTSGGCTLDQYPSSYSSSSSSSSSSGSRRRSSLYTAEVLGTTCESSGSNNDGCAFLDSDTSSYGQGFNNAGGGVYAHLWDNTGIKVWRWTRSQIPSDITNGSPNPSGWGTPVAFWSSATCDMSSHFYQHQLVFDTTLGGDWAGGAYSSSGCPGTVEEEIADPSNFVNAKWVINYVAVYNS